MSLEQAYRNLVESENLKESGLPAKGETKETPEQKAQPGSTTRGQDQTGTTVPDQGSTVETPAQKMKPGSSKRTQDQDAMVPDNKGTEAPAPTKVTAPDMKGNFTMEENDTQEKNLLAGLESIVEFKLSDELGSLLESADLGEEFNTKVTTIFEAAVNAAATSHIAKLEEQAAQILSEEVEAYKARTDEQVEQYLDYVVEQWMEENKVALQSTTRATIAEAFMSDMHDLLEKYNVELDEDKVDMFEAAISEKDELDAALTEAAQEIVALRAQLHEKDKQLQLESFVADLTDVEAEKIRELAEGVDFESAEQFGKKLEMLKENFIGSESTKRSPSSDLMVEDVEGNIDEAVTTTTTNVDPEMAQYLSWTSKMKPVK